MLDSYSGLRCRGHSRGGGAGSGSSSRTGNGIGFVRLASGTSISNRGVFTNFFRCDWFFAVCVGFLMLLLRFLFRIIRRIWGRRCVLVTVVPIAVWRLATRFKFVRIRNARGSIGLAFVTIGAGCNGNRKCMLKKLLKSQPKYPVLN